MKIKLNGKIFENNNVQLTISDILSINNVESPDMVVVQLNGQFVDKSDYQAMHLKENDEIDFLYFMAGGFFEKNFNNK